MIIDAGIEDANGNTAKLPIRDDPLYTGMKQARKMTKSADGVNINEPYYGAQSLIAEFMTACTSVFGKDTLLQFEDFSE